MTKQLNDATPAEIAEQNKQLTALAAKLQGISWLKVTLQRTNVNNPELSLDVNTRYPHPKYVGYNFIRLGYGPDPEITLPIVLPVSRLPEFIALLDHFTEGV